MNKKLLILGMIAIFFMGQCFGVNSPEYVANFLPAPDIQQMPWATGPAELLGMAGFYGGVAGSLYVSAKLSEWLTSKTYAEQQVDPDGKADSNTFSDVEAMAALAGLLVVIGLGVQ